MEYMKKKYLILTAFVISAIIAPVILITILSGMQDRKFEPVPSIVIVHASTEHSISRYGYDWQGLFAPLPNEPFRFTTPPLNLTQGSTIEFQAKNASRQADYYQVTVRDAVQDEIDDSDYLLESSRLDKGKLLLDFEKGSYSIFVTGYWITVDIYWQHTDSVTYGTILNLG